MSLRSVNLNLIPVLRVLLKEGNVARASAVLGLSRSATSEALGRLRDTLGDPLLIQIGRDMVLTPRAAELIEPVEQLCASAEALLHQAPFDAATSARDFVIATSDYGVALAAPKILAMRRSNAPAITADFVEAGRDIAKRLAARDHDFAILARFYLDDMDFNALRFRPLFRNKLVAVMRPHHPLADIGVLSVPDLEKWPLITVMPEPGIVERHRVEQVYGLGAFPVAVRVQHVTLVPELVRTSDCWAILPNGVAAASVDQRGLVQRDLPRPMQQTVDMCLVWSIVCDFDPAHRWFRDALIASCNPSV